MNDKKKPVKDKNKRNKNNNNSNNNKNKNNINDSNDDNDNNDDIKADNDDDDDNSVIQGLHTMFDNEARKQSKDNKCVVTLPNGKKISVVKSTQRARILVSVFFK